MYSTVQNLVHSTIYTAMFSSLKSTMLCAMCRRQVKCVPEGLSQVCNFYAWVQLMLQYSVQYTVHYTVHCTMQFQACVVFRRSLSCDYTAREDPRGLARLDYGVTHLSAKAYIIGHIAEIVGKVILLWLDFFFFLKVPS